jgi:hypothetical protein
MQRAELLRFARLGAQARLEALQGEIDALIRQFPGLAKGSQAAGRRGRPAQQAAPVSGAAAPKPRRMSPAARKRISDAAKKRWTEWRKTHKRQ